MRVVADNCLVRFVNTGTNQKGQPYAAAFVQQDGNGRVDELSINLEKTEGEMPERDVAYDFDVDIFDGNYGTSKRITAMRRVSAPALAKTG